MTGKDLLIGLSYVDEALLTKCCWAKCCQGETG